MTLTIKRSTTTWLRRAQAGCFVRQINKYGDSMDFFDWIIFFVVGGVVVGVVQLVHTSYKKKGMEEKLADLKDFKSTQKFMGEDGDSGIAVDEIRKKVCLIKQGVENVELVLFTYRDILASEVFEDGVTVTKTARGSQLGGALIGGLALGGIGAIIGGLSGKRTSSEKVTRIDLRITVNNISDPVHDINFMNVEGKKHGLVYNASMQQARHWHGLLAVLIKRADSEDISTEEGHLEGKTGFLPRNYVADEILKLAELRKQGLLTEEEFATEKARLLA